MKEQNKYVMYNCLESILTAIGSPPQSKSFKSALNL